MQLSYIIEDNILSQEQELYYYVLLRNFSILSSLASLLLNIKLQLMVTF